MAQNYCASDDALTIEDLAGHLILSESGAKRLVQAFDIPTSAPASADPSPDWNHIRFSLEAIRRWEANHHIVYAPREPRGG